jgi:hypothetical protein
MKQTSPEEGLAIVEKMFEALDEQGYSRFDSVSIFASGLCSLLVSSIASEEKLHIFFETFKEQTMEHFRKHREK